MAAMQAVRGRWRWTGKQGPVVEEFCCIQRRADADLYCLVAETKERSRASPAAYVESRRLGDGLDLKGEGK